MAIIKPNNNTISAITALPFVTGITEFDMFRLTADQSGGTNAVISSNLERVDTGGWGQLGTGMSVSSGIFTFPSTGIWLVKFRVTNNHNGESKNVGKKNNNDNIAGNKLSHTQT